MITSVIMFKLKEKSSENALLVKEKLLSMKGNVDELKDIEVGINLNEGATPFDLVMVARYNSRDDFNVYAKHPFHVNVGKFVLELCEQTAAVLYEE
jgi:hypothetical protein